MSDEQGTTSIRVIPFSGNVVDWPVGSENLLARARRKGYKKILLGEEVVPDDAEDLDAITKQNEKKKKERL